MVYGLFLGVHIAAGIAGLVLGVFAFRPPRHAGDRALLRKGYLASLIVLIVAITGAVAAHWSDLDGMTRFIFVALIVLGGVIIARGYLALRTLREEPSGWRIKYLDHIYFTYISLWEGLVIVALIDLGFPWLAPIAAIGILLIGNVMLRRYKALTT